ncbi:MAG: asparagine synthase (glutamine-hydrolyzing) [Ferrovibrio sp.]|uniref:asparagine synthase (glutamine-hydrolyzing) n=1 Tax=Ferrovibrio sp. TaxID=1917215 RepID=UPI00260C02EC|nr:asparagine synthase (glutamine-hydrolyzing) [Ferrovibrio sp.]MCW0234933.1 asparagine synthase (glutamine-hydrolyzing) [Ferrovibrio sp.]
MCGIAGSFGNTPLSNERVAATLAAMNNRGPDAAAHWQGDLAGHGVNLLHTRLAIVDLDDRSNQPFVKDHLSLCYNGEIYNYKELRHELEGLGHTFITDSDTEVVIEAYRRWGVDCLKRMEGMWAFALTDGKAGSLLLSRDRFGEKPLYYRWDATRKTLYFASQTSFLRTLGSKDTGLNHDHIRRFLVQGYKSLFKSPDSYYNDVRQLPQASYALLTRPAEPQPVRYWTLSYAPRNMSLHEAEMEIRRLVDDALRLRLRADVPIAFCLSGGVDSTTLAGIAHHEFRQSIHAFSIYDDDSRYDESENVERVVRTLGCDHHITHTSKDGFLERMKRLIAYHDAPLATISFYVESFLAEAIRANGYKVAITGTGADELFTGYYDHYNFWLADRQKSGNIDDLITDWRKGYGGFVRNPVLSDPLCFAKQPERRDHIYLNEDIFNGLMHEPMAAGFHEMPYGGDLLHRRLLNEIWHESLPLLLDQNDLVFMQESIENRTPFLDRQLAEFLFTVPAEHLIYDGYPKWLLRAAGAGRVPDEVRLDRRKRGFNVPIGSLIDVKSAETRDWMMADGPIFDIVDRTRFTDFLESADERNSFSKFIFSFISARIFLDQAEAAAS